MSSPATLRTWLKQKPPPVKVRATLDDGNERMIVVGSTSSKWRDLETSLARAVEADALSIDGEVLRSWRSPNFDAEEVAERETKTSGVETSQLVAIAKLLAQASDQAVKRHAEAYKSSHDALLAIVQTVLDRLSSLETVLHERMLDDAEEARAARDEAAKAQANADPNTNMVMGLLAQAGIAGAMAPSPNGQGESK